MVWCMPSCFIKISTDTPRNRASAIKRCIRSASANSIRSINVSNSSFLGRYRFVVIGIEYIVSLPYVGWQSAINLL